MEASGADDSMVLNALFSQSPQGLFVLDTELRVVRFNPSARALRRLSAEEVVGHTVGEFAPGFPAAELTGLAREVLATGEPLRDHLVRGSTRTQPRHTLAVEVSLFRLNDADGGVLGLVAVLEDVTERQAAADRLAVLGRVHRTVGSTLDERSTAGELARALAPGFAEAAFVHLSDAAGGGGAARPGPLPADTPLRVAGHAPESARPPDRGGGRPFPFPTPFTQVLNDARARLLTLSADTPWLRTDPERFAPLVEAGVHSMIVAPLRVRDEVLGLLTLCRTLRTDAFGEADLDLARQAALAGAAHLDNARAYHREHTIASALQHRLQPRPAPELSAVETAQVYLPESAGGDWFDVIPLSGARVALVVGDVTGHGIEAAATMGQLRIALRGLASQDLEPDELFTHLDEVAAIIGTEPPDASPAYVATCAVAVYDPVTLTCVLLRAGHPAPVVLDPQGAPVAVEVPEGPALGAGGGGGYTPVSVQLAPGSLLALYTDGLVAACGPDESCRRRRLENFLAPMDRSLTELADTALYALAPPRDDDAVLLLARTRALPQEHVTVWTLPTDGSVVATARRLVEQQLSAWGLSGAASDTELIVSELVTNAILHGKGPIRLRLILDGDRLLSEVTDANGAAPHLRHAREGDEGGRGLFIVMRLSSRWGVRHTRRDKTIWSEQRLVPERDGAA
ncbi:SpoIIE family protein phosphatase [Streptomyces sp. SID8352]|uniref:SpoIIE family protein phosphatase n=1 Tax=Streptomyces sp. SID8352 TaxID=2690338 RepID=UPI0031F641E3